MSKHNCPRCGKYVKGRNPAKRIEQHQKDSAFCQSMTAEEHKVERKAEVVNGDSESWSIADQTVEGAMCSGCGICFHDAHGFPVLCRSCFHDLSPSERGILPCATIQEF